VVQSSLLVERRSLRDRANVGLNSLPSLWRAACARTAHDSKPLHCATHTHPSWRSFAAILLQPVPPDRYEITFDDVPVDTRVSFRINDQNSCDQNPTGAVTRNVSVNNVDLVQNATTPGQGDEPGFAFSVTAGGRVTQ
jgi:hypothetical protein